MSDPYAVNGVRRWNGFLWKLVMLVAVFWTLAGVIGVAGQWPMAAAMMVGSGIGVLPVAWDGWKRRREWKAKL